ncbi:cilia- and flagella-associated protein 206 isoform X2 [Uranotaenia lowii]|uniref:cilia- and flagella-associated protein 206 isoform X2 n=1 Tax=Uranotaenia lowii TaxID=190385 RepID=UPI0024796AB2|nr:cilia- and flagella-associated protein 206 isoform X2 [Uranotaenia lowii]
MMYTNLKTYLLESNANLKPLLYEIVKQCERNNIRYEKQLVTFIMNLVSLDPKFEIYMETLSADRRNHDDFVEECVSILNDRSPKLITLRMQLYFLQNFFNKDEVVEKHSRNLQLKTSHLLKEITEHDVITKDEQDDIFSKVIIDIVMNMGLGSPDNKDVLQETTKALNSVMSRSDKAKFVTLDKKDRLLALKDIREIVCGIRIFNKHAGNSSNGMSDLPRILDQSHESTKSILQITLCEIMDKVNLLTSALNSSIAYDLRNHTIVTLLPENISSEDLNIVKDLLIMYRQHEVFTRKLIDEMALIKFNIDTLNQEYSTKLTKIHETVQYRTAIPTDRVFPKFSELTRIWLQFQNYIYLLSEINQINNTLTNMTEKCLSFDDLAYRLLGEYQVQTDMDRLNKTMGKRLITTKNETVEYNPAMKVEMLKFCVWHLAEGNGVLMPGNVEMGVCQYQNEYYAFNLPQAVAFFDEDPDKYIFRIIELARKRIQFVVFLDIFHKVQNAYNSQSTEVFRIKAPVTCEQEIQTELHPVPCNIDHHYRWNVWDIGKEAITLANLRTKKTSSSQTKKSKCTQIYLPKDQQTQTKFHKATVTKEHRPRTKKVQLPAYPLEVYSISVEGFNNKTRRQFL